MGVVFGALNENGRSAGILSVTLPVHISLLVFAALWFIDGMMINGVNRHESQGE